MTIKPWRRRARPRPHASRGERASGERNIDGHSRPTQYQPDYRRRPGQHECRVVPADGRMPGEEQREGTHEPEGPSLADQGHIDPPGPGQGQPDGGHGHQWLAVQGDTGVEPVHRNRGLGRWSKATNVLRLLEERPDTQVVETWHAGVNAPMLTINDAMGFRPVAECQEWRLDVDSN
jgi:hypothetical protein